MDQSNLLIGIVIQSLNGNSQEASHKANVYPNYSFLLSPEFPDFLKNFDATENM